MTVAEGLATVRDRIAQGWCRDYLAKDRTGFPCDPCSPDARVWSLNGALVLLAKDAEKVGEAILRAAKKHSDKTWSTVSQLNNDRNLHKAIIVEIVNAAITTERLKRHVAANKKR